MALIVCKNICKQPVAVIEQMRFVPAVSVRVSASITSSPPTRLQPSAIKQEEVK
jgi:hypothetical protein